MNSLHMGCVIIAAGPREAGCASACIGVFMEKGDVLEQIRQADMVLVGLGEEFDDVKRLRDDTAYQSGRQMLLETGYDWLIPAWSEYCSGKLENVIVPALENLLKILDGKNYFLVSLSTNSSIELVTGGTERLVKPCGGVLEKQCARGCEGELLPLEEKDREILKAFFNELYEGHYLCDSIPELGKCTKCGGSMVLNNIFAENYNESAYLGRWQRYTRWLQGTLNHQLFLLELGVGMQFPTVVRWPFEKIAAYNEKAILCRIHEKLYHLPKEISLKGYGISKNAIDWLGQL